MGKQKRTGDIVVLSIGDTKDIIIRLTGEMLTEEYNELFDNGFFKTRTATLLEKKYWFEGYDLGYYGLSMDGFKEWVEHGKA